MIIINKGDSNVNDHHLMIVVIVNMITITMIRGNEYFESVLRSWCILYDDIIMVIFLVMIVYHQHDH